MLSPLPYSQAALLQSAGRGRQNNSPHLSLIRADQLRVMTSVMSPESPEASPPAHPEAGNPSCLSEGW